MSLLLKVQQESPAKKTRLHCDVDNNLITSTTPNTNTPSRTISRDGRRGSVNGGEWSSDKNLLPSPCFPLVSVNSRQLVNSPLQRQPIMTGVRRSPMAAWRRRRLLRWPALPGPPFLGPSSPLFSTSSHQLKMVSIRMMECVFVKACNRF